MMRIRKVYVVTEGSYSDYHIVGIFSSNKLAEKYRYELGADGIEPYEVDALIFSLYTMGYTRYEVQFHDDKTWVDEYRSTFDLDRLYEKRIFAKKTWGIGNIKVTLFAKDEKHAVKVASEIRAQVVASGVIEQYFKDNPAAMIYDVYSGYAPGELNAEVE